MGCGPSLEVPEQLEEGNHTNDSREVRHGCHSSTESVGVRVELDVSTSPLSADLTYAWSEEERDQEEQSQHGHVPNNRSEGDDSNSK